MSSIVVLLVAIVVVAYFAIKSTYSAKPDILPESLDLDSVRDGVMEKQGWSLERAEAARTEYVRFLKLLQMKPGFMLVPWPNELGQDDLDQFWHQHILDTAKYAADCDRLFGRMIHHNPHVTRGSEQESDANEKTQRLYARTFGSGSYGRPVDAAFLTSCGSCAAVDSHTSEGHGHGEHGWGGHSHTDHGSGSHGDGGGGHDGGGHSCGGHSCGHGCGGH